MTPAIGRLDDGEWRGLGERRVRFVAGEQGKANRAHRQLASRRVAEASG